ncbi:MAG: 30S ribosomal protein S9 [Parcubacteria group bacterium]|jgi:small subunit ribosomal protein S9
MVTKKVKEKAEPKEEAKASRYFYGLGKRKTAIAQVRIYVAGKEGKGVVVNEKSFEKYFPIARLRDLVKEPLALAGQDAKFDVSARVHGGGVNAQAEAIRLGISRALIEFNPELRKSLRDNGFLTRDSRIVERKKPGLRKARRAPQWAKR